MEEWKKVDLLGSAAQVGRQDWSGAEDGERNLSVSESIGLADRLNVMW